MKIKTIIAVAAVSVLLVASCSKKNLETTYSSQETKISSIVTSLTNSNPDATVDYLDGIVRVTVVPGEGETLTENGAVSFYYAGYTVSGSSLSTSNLFATNYEEFASSAGWNVTDSTLFTIKTLDLSSESVVEGLQKGLVGVKAGDECYVMFSGKHGFGKKVLGKIPSNSALAYHLWIRGVTN